ncbi:MAG: PAS domain S-box protein [Leptothrix sp. (in: b-proteobacteria)]
MSDPTSPTHYHLPASLLDSLSDPVLVFERSGHLHLANQAALRLLPCEPGMGLADFDRVFDAATMLRLRSALASASASVSVPWAPSGRSVPSLWRISAQHWALLLPIESVQARPQPGVAVAAMADGPLRELHGLLWSTPFPAILQDESFRLIDVNAAYAALIGWPRERLVGRDPIELQPEADRAATLADRARLLQNPRQPEAPALIELRLLDVTGQRHWLRAVRHVALTQDGRRLLLTLMQDGSAEQAAREQAERAARELDQWFQLSPFGMALFDDGGLVLRANLTFESMVGQPLIELRDAGAPLHKLLHWSEHRLQLDLEPGGPWVSSEGPLSRSADGSQRWVRAHLRCHEARGGQRRYMCLLEDRSAEEDRDLLRQQLAALVDTARVGLATFRGAQTVFRSSEDELPHIGALQGIRRELVVPASLPEFERLQRAFKQGERCEARYAIQHPELGLRWLVTRVAPGRSGPEQPTTSVVTLDVTEQQRTQERAEQLLTELATILESSPAGIASMRGYTLMHCNRRFERMLRLPAGAGVGSDVRQLLASRSSGLADPQALAATLDAGQLFEAELEVSAEEGGSHWYALSVRRTGPAGSAPQAIAVLSEITRLKAQQVELEELAVERARMAHVLGQQADRTRAVLDSVLVGIVTVDERGQISWLNRSARRMFGGGLGDFLGQPIDATATHDSHHPFRRSFELFAELRDGEAVQFECRVQARDGRTFWVVGNAVATLGASGARELTYALMDIEQRRQAEARVAEARESLQRIIEAAPMAISLWDASSLVVLQLNHVAAELSGCEAAAALGQPPEQLYSAELAARVRADMRSSLAAPTAVTQREYLFERSEELGGRQVWEARYLPLLRDGQPPEQLLLVASDVTAQRAAQRAELEAAIAQRDMLVQEVHHRIKNNLQGVAGLMQQIAARRPEVQPIIAEVVGQVQAIAQVYGLQVGAVGPLKIRNVVEAIAQSVQRTFGRHIELKLEGPSSLQWTLPESEAIPIALTLNELLTNAIKHSPAGSAVGARLIALPEGVRVEISNEGRLPDNFRLDHRPSAVSGLGLVRALLPRRNASLGIEQSGTQVLAQVALAPPVVLRLVVPDKVRVGALLP